MSVHPTINHVKLDNFGKGDNCWFSPSVKGPYSLCS